MVDRDRSWQHPWLRVSLLLRAILREPWDGESWSLIRREVPKAVAERARIAAGWFIHENASPVKAVMSGRIVPAKQRPSIIHSRSLRMTSYTITGDWRSPMVGVPIN